MAINDKLIIPEAAGGGGGLPNAEQGLRLQLDANDVDSYDGDGDIWYDISTFDKLIPLSDNAASLEVNLDASDSTSYGGTGTTWTDISGNSNNATISGAVYGEDLGGYFDFDGSNDYVQISPIPATLQADAIITGEAWINPKSATNNSIISFRGSNNPEIKFFLAANSSGQVYLVSSSTSTFLAFGTTSSNSVPVGQWTHVAATINYNTKTYAIYINGDLASSGSQSNIRSRSTFGATFFLIGANKIGTQHSNLKIGQVRVYNTALSASDIGQNYRHGRDIIYTSLYDTNLDLHLDAGNTNSYPGTGTTWSDLTSNGNNGTITGATWEEELGNSFEFDGTNDIIKNSSLATAFRSQTTLSIEAWFKTSAGTARLTIASFSATGDATTDLWLGFYASTNTLAFRNVNDGANVFDCRNIGGSNLRDGNWHHVVFTADSGGTHIYVDGDEITGYSFNYGSASTNIVMPTDLNQFGIGGNTDSGGDQWFMNGQIGQVRAYDAALTAAQVGQNFNFTKPRYPNGYDGTISGATWNAGGYFNFDGSNDYVSLNQGNNMSGGLFNNFSISYWVKLDTTSTLGRHFYAYSSSSNYILLYYNHSLGGMRLGGGNINTQQASYTMSANTWYHIVVTQSSENVSLYVDTSRKINSNQSIGTYDDIKVTLGAADQNGSISNSLDGKISKFRLYDKILTTTEIDTLYNEGE